MIRKIQSELVFRPQNQQEKGTNEQMAHAGINSSSPVEEVYVCQCSQGWTHSEMADNYNRGICTHYSLIRQLSHRIGGIAHTNL